MNNGAARFVRRAFCGLLLFAAFLLQTAPGLFAAVSAKPLLLADAVVCLSAFRGLREGWAYAVTAGLLWDVGVGKPFGFSAFFLVLSATAAALLFDYYFKPNLMSLAVACAVCAAGYLLFDFLCFDLASGGAPRVLFEQAPKTLGFTVLTTPLIYLPAKAAAGKERNRAG